MVLALRPPPFKVVLRSANLNALSSQGELNEMPVWSDHEDSPSVCPYLAQLT